MLRAGVDQSIHQRMPRDRARLPRNGDHHRRTRHRMMKRFADKKTKHRLRHIIISDDAILYRPLQRNILWRLVVMNERLRAKAQYMAVDVIHRDRTRFSKDHFIFPVDTDLGRAHVHTDPVR